MIRLSWLLYESIEGSAKVSLAGLGNPTFEHQGAIFWIDIHGLEAMFGRDQVTQRSRVA
jgi:hypothetical protein